MKINLDNHNLKKVNDLFLINEKNIEVSDTILDFLYFSNIAKDEKQAAEIKKHINPKVFHKLDKNDYLKNPYVKNIKLDNIKENKYQFHKNHYEPNECILYTEIDVDSNYNEITHLGYFDDTFSYLELLDGKDIWMLITPHEINTMKKAISNAKGKVITFGLGLGYFSYMCSLKEDVESVTIIEKDKTIISLFEKHLLPQFENKDKIKIINDDALNYIDNKSFDYDYAFIDLYKDIEDGLPLYIKMFQKAKKHSNTRFDYWIEISMLIMLRRCLITLLYEEKNNFEDDNTELSLYDVIILKFKNILKDYQINTFEDVKKLISFDNIKQLIYKL